jgi:hypothetical protein
MDSTMIVVDDQRLVNAKALADHCEQNGQEVIAYLAGLALRGGVAAYNEQGETLGRADLVADENDNYLQFFINPDELGQYFGEGRAEESDLDLADDIERVLDQI